MPDSEALKILFVDDEPDLVPLIRQKFRSQVRSGEIALVFASDGVEALEHLEADPDIEVVVTDINMPRMDGLTLLGKLGDLERRTKAVVVTAYSDMENIRTAMNRGAFDFLTKPIDMADLDITVNQARTAVERDREADRVRRTITRYLSDKIAQAVLSNPDAVQASERREVSVLMSDIAGFSQLAERLEPERVVEVLNVYLSHMTEVIDDHEGAIDEFIGDAVLAIFGAPLEMEDHAAQAVACAVAMQARMSDVNRSLSDRGLPALEMTAAVNSGEVVVGTIGSETRAKYGVVGSAVNLTSRIQSLAVPGEVLISDRTYADAGGEGGALQLSGTRMVSLKGFSEPVAVHSVESVAGAHVEHDETPLRDLADPFPFQFATLDGKELAPDAHDGELLAVSETGAWARVSPSVEIESRTDVCLTLETPEGNVDVYAKVADVDDDGERTTLRLRFSSVPPEAAAVLASRS